MSAPPPLLDSKQALPPNQRRSGTRTVIAALLNVTFGLFLADAVVSLLDATLVLGFGFHALDTIQGITFILVSLASILVYLLLGLAPTIPKRYFLPIVLFNPLGLLASIPLLIFHYDRLQQIAWVFSFCQVLFGLSILFWVQGAFGFRWPVFRREQLGSKAFAWRNLSGFLLANVFALPGVFLYLALCASLAVNHFSGGFLALRWDGLMVRAKTYVRGDKTIRLIPMMHIGEANFYDQISKSFPTNAVVLLEGVTDDKNLLKHIPRYQHTAQSLGLVAQQDTFEAPQCRQHLADLDVEQFSKENIALLDLVGLGYSKGWNVERLQQLYQESAKPLFVEQLMDDLLAKRNAHLLGEIEAELPNSDLIAVPWGAVHMPGIAEEIQKSGFSISQTQQFQIVHFRSIWNHFAHSKKKTY